MSSDRDQRLTFGQAEAVMRRPNGYYALLELVRMGRVDSATAVRVLDRLERPSLLRRIGLALVDAVFGQPHPGGW